MKKLSMTCALIIALSGVLGIIYTLDSRWAKAEEVALISQRLDEKIAGDRSDRVQQRIWQIEDRYKGKTVAEPDLQLYRELKKELNDLNIKMKKK